MKKMKGYQGKKQGDMMLNANELYQNLSAAIQKEIQDSIPTISFHRYPDETNAALIQAYANVMKIPAQQILAGNGSDEMLGLMIGYFLGKAKVLYTLSPDFSMYDYYASMYESTILKFTCEEDGSFSVPQFIQEGKKQDVHMILFSNPNNPTGHRITNAQVCQIVEAFPNIPVIIDEAYAEFAEESMIEMLTIYDNLYITRTLSKAYGLAAARLGFLLSNTFNIAQIRPYVVPYNISSITQKIGTIVLQHAEAFTSIIAGLKKERERVFTVCQTLQSMIVYPSHANYLYGRSVHKSALLAYLEQEGIVIRSYQDDSFRITIGEKSENDKVIMLLQTFDKEVVKR